MEKCRTFLKGIDVNIIPTNTEEEVGVSSPNSSISSLSGNKRNEREIINCCDELEIERECSRSISDEEDGETSRKKLRLTKDQSIVLEESFKEHNTLNPVSLFFKKICPSRYLNSFILYYLSPFLA